MKKQQDIQSINNTIFLSHITKYYITVSGDKKIIKHNKQCLLCFIIFLSHITILWTI
jgi:hypothetical protein